MTRRTLLARSSAVAAGALAANLPIPLIRRAAAASERRPVSMAMHVHSSFSEGSASMATHLAQAASNGVDVIWWTDHDWRMAARYYREVVHFDSLSEPEHGQPWAWTLRRTGSALLASSDLTAAAAAPADPSATKSGLALRVMSTGPEPASVQMTANTHPARINLNGNIDGLQLHLEVCPQRVGRLGYLEITVPLSYHPSSGGRPAGQYRLCYRIGGTGRPGSRTADGLAGIATLDVPTGRWASVTVSPMADVGRIWPDLDARDMAINGFSLSATSQGKALSAGLFDYVRFHRSVIGAAAQGSQAAIMAAYRSAYPNVTQHAALEISLYDPHVNAFGGAQSLPDYGDVPLNPGRSEPVTAGLISAVHAGGGIASYNHPFGSASAGAALGTPARQDAARAEVAAGLIRGRALGANLLEVGYPRRGGVTMARHIAAWDACSRNAIFLTGNGATDDHTGTDWRGGVNRFITSAWSPSRSEADLTAALLAGRAYASDLVDFTGTLDLLLDGQYPMGSVTVGRAATHALAVLLTGAPPGGAVRVLRGRVDYAGPAVPDSNAVTIAVLPAAAFATGRVEVPIDGSAPCYLRAEVADANGRVVALSNPIWALRSWPPGGIPAARRG